MQRVTCAPGGSDPDVTLTADGREIGTKSEAVSECESARYTAPVRSFWSIDIPRPAGVSTANSLY
jgi:hypothetical protein